MKNFVEYLLVRLVDNPDDLVVEEVEVEEGVEIRISVNPEDMGRVIGRGGQVIKAIRKLVQVKAARDGVWARVVLLED